MSDDAPDVKSRGGVGAVRTPRGDLESMRLLRRALKAGWNVPPKAKRLATSRMVKILKASENERAVVAAARVLVAMNGAELGAVDAAARVRNAVEIEVRIKSLEREREPR